MATLTASPASSPAKLVTRAASRAWGETIHRALLGMVALAAAGVILFLAVKGFPYYTLSLEERPLSPLHAQFRSSGTVGLRIGLLAVGMFGILFLYPLRKRWKWLATIGSTRRWLNFHILFGISTPLVVTFHTAFRWHGVAGLAYWTMMVVALSGFVGRYVYAKIPRSITSAELTMTELEAQAAELAANLSENTLVRNEDIAPLLKVPSAKQIRSMSLAGTLWTMLRMDLVRPFQVSRLRWRVLSGGERIQTLGGLLPSHNERLESMIWNVRRQSRLRAAMAFLDRTGRIFHLWHVVHRPFSISFVILILFHIGVALSVGVLRSY